MLMQNPEFKKNFRLEVSLTRLGICAALLLLIGFALHGDTDSYPDSAYRYASKYFNAFCGIGYFFVIIWGTYLAASSISDEVRQKTWDFVRMSSLSPAKILVGKLFGSTSLIWIVSLVGIMPVLLVAASKMMIAHPMTQAVHPSPGAVLFYLSVSIIAWALLSHAVGLIFSLHAMLQQREKEKLNTIGATLLVAFGGMWVGAITLNGFEEFHQTYRMGYTHTTSWYGHDLFTIQIAMMGLAFYAFWTIVGAYRMLRQSLLFLDRPWIWAAFLIGVSLFMNGFTPEQEFTKFLFWPILLGAATTAMMAINETRDIVRYKTFAARMGAGQHGEALRYLPLWMISFAFMLISIFLSLVIIDSSLASVFSVLSLITFAIRDLLVLHWLSWKPTIRRPLLAYAIYAGIAYILLPAIIGPGSVKGAQFFYPLPPKYSPIDFTAGTENGMMFFYWAFQVAAVSLAGWLFSKRWKTAFGKNATLPVTADRPQTAV